MKLDIILAITVLTTFITCKQNNGYLRIEKKYTDREQLISSILPNKEIIYWKYVETSSNRIVKEVGNKRILSNYKIEEPNQGFFVECHPGFCYSYIIYIDNNGLNYVTDERALLDFIGKIDNVSEAILVGKTQGLRIDEEDERGGSYKKTKNGYEMNLLKYKGCPETYESVNLEIDFNGYFKMKSNGIYKKTGNCIVS
jgi:hypothetical protein